MSPSIVPEEMIDDSADFKPADWDEREKIEDPEATKPEDWDEDAPAKIVDESAVMPEGEFRRLLICHSIFVNLTIFQSIFHRPPRKNMVLMF